MATQSLESLGFTPFFRQSFAQLGDEGLVPARVVVAHRGVWICGTADGERPARFPGRLRYAARDAREVPTVGDWVGLRLGEDAGGLATIEALLPRATSLTRQASGRAAAPQVLAANVDVVLIVTSANADFSAARLGRYRAAVAAGGAEPVVVVNKADLLDDAALSELRERVPRGMRVVTTSAFTGAGLDALSAELLPGSTVVLVGSSGVGKSTLLNCLLGESHFATSEVRVSDDTGRHTTTRRELVALPSGALLIDTPGIRELALWVSEGDGEDFDAIGLLARDCRFSDCSHQGEPGCAVLAAVEAGDIDPDELSDHLQLEREAAWQRRRQDPAAARDHGRAFQKMVREYQSLVKHKRR